MLESGGERGIRTLEGLLTLTPLAGVRLRPLGHLSAVWEAGVIRDVVARHWRLPAPRGQPAHHTGNAPGMGRENGAQREQPKHVEQTDAPGCTKDQTMEPAASPKGIGTTSRAQRISGQAPSPADLRPVGRRRVRANPRGLRDRPCVPSGARDTTQDQRGT